MAEKNLSSSSSSLIEDKIRLRKRIDHRSPIQCSTIPEGEIYHSTVRRTSLSIPCQSSRSPSRSSTTNSFEYSRKKFQSFYRSLIPSKSSTETTKKSFEQSNRKETMKIPFPFSSTTNCRKSCRERNYRYSLPDTSTRTFILKNLRQKNGKISLKNSSNDETVRSTFQNLLSLVKFPSNKSNSTVSTNPSTTSSNHIKWNFHIERSEWLSSVGIGRIRLFSIELHNLTSIEIEHLQRNICDKFERSTLEMNIPFHLLKDEPIRKRKHHFMFRSKSTDKSKETKESKSSGNIFGIALSECVQDEQENRSDDQNKFIRKKEENLSDSNQLKTTKDQFLSPSISSSSINDSGFSLSPTSPTSLKIGDVERDCQEKRYRSISLEALGFEDLSSGISRSNTLRCYPAKVPELIRICCQFLENYGLQTVGLFRVGVSKKRLKELKDQINLNRTLTFDCSTNVHDIAGLMKEFLRELPEPLLTRHLSIPFLQIRPKIPLEEQNEVLADLIRLLPSSNRDTLYQLLKFLHHVSLNSQDRYSSDGKLISIGNKMDTENLSIVFAPTILLDNKTSKDSSLTINAEQIEHGKDILKLMIENYKDLFMIEKNLHDQICYSICQLDDQQLNRLLAFKIQNRCGISTMELDDENEEYLRSIDLKCLSMNEISIDNGIVSSSSNETFQRKDSTIRRYNLRRNSDFPTSSSSSHSSRSSEYLQVPLSKSHQRLTNSSSRVRDIREARMDKIIFRLIHPEFPSTTNSSNDESSNEITSATTAAVPTAQLTTTTTTFPLFRELRSYCRSKTAPLALSISGKFSSTAKTCEAKDLCGTSSKDSTN